MLDKNIDNLELRIRIIEGEIRENKRGKEKCWDNVLSVIVAFVFIIGISSYHFFAKKEFEVLAIILSIILLLSCLFLGPYWYNKYKKKQKQIEKLEEELKRLKEGLKE